MAVKSQMASGWLNSAEPNYSTVERETLAVIFGVKNSSIPIQNPFILTTDHKPLGPSVRFDERSPTTCGTTDPAVGPLPSSLRILYTIRYKAGKQNINADALSSLPLAEMHAL